MVWELWFFSPSEAGTRSTTDTTLHQISQKGTAYSVLPVHSRCCSCCRRLLISSTAGSSRNCSDDRSLNPLISNSCNMTGIRAAIPGVFLSEDSLVIITSGATSGGTVLRICICLLSPGLSLCVRSDVYLWVNLSVINYLWIVMMHCSMLCLNGKLEHALKHCKMHLNWDTETNIKLLMFEQHSFT